MRKHRSPLLWLFPGFFLLSLGLVLLLTNLSFCHFTDTLFRNELSGSTLSLHYTLRHPEKYGLSDLPVTLGSADPDALTASFAVLEQYRSRLRRFPRLLLTPANRLTRDILSLYLKHQSEGQKFALYTEPLGPTVGTQAQLPVLLSEYAFREKDDITAYLALLTETEEYFSSLLRFEQEKSQRGLFMSSSAAQSVIDQCRSFIQKPEENLLITLFSEKLNTCDFLTEPERKRLRDANREAVLEHVIPAYRTLISGMSALKDTGKNQKGLSYLPDGKAYYAWLLRDSTGVYASVEAVRDRIQMQLRRDYRSLTELARAHPELLARETLSSAVVFALDNSPNLILNADGWYASDPEGKAAAERELTSMTPNEILEDLRGKIRADFPSPPETDFTVRYIHRSLEKFLSPAFYLTPPIDDRSENIIYINRSSTYTALDLYTTLAHEGYPGHLYQTVCSGESGLSPIRSLLNFPGYVEGWATYVELYAYSLAPVNPNQAELYRLNRSLTLGISSLMDIAVHYFGFSIGQVRAYLGQFGFTTASADALYEALLEAPANYLKYYVGYLSFQDLRDTCAAREGRSFDLREFHRRVLSVGPAPFSLVARYALR